MFQRCAFWLLTFLLVSPQEVESKNLNGNRFRVEEDWTEDDDAPMSKLPSLPLYEKSFVPWNLRLLSEEAHMKKNKIVDGNRYRKRKAMTPEELASLLLDLRDKGGNDLSLDGLRFG